MVKNLAIQSKIQSILRRRRIFLEDTIDFHVLEHKLWGCASLFSESQSVQTRFSGSLYGRPKSWSDIQQLINDWFRPGPMLIRNQQSTHSPQLCEMAEAPTKKKRVYNTLTQALAFSNLKPKEFELVHSP